MNIAVIGAGAMGSLYATLLSLQAKVVVIDGWEEQINALQSKGLTLMGISGELLGPDEGFWIMMASARYGLMAHWRS